MCVCVYARIGIFCQVVTLGVWYGRKKDRTEID
nr:MAG TPA: Transactivating regulatory protein (Tat) [Caudoviricetes sp.]